MKRTPLMTFPVPEFPAMTTVSRAYILVPGISMAVDLMLLGVAGWTTEVRVYQTDVGLEIRRVRLRKETKGRRAGGKSARKA